MSAPLSDSLTNYQFVIEVDSVEIVRFKEVSGIGAEITVIEGKQNNTKGLPIHTKQPGWIKHPDVVCKRGSTGDRAWWDWIKQVQDGKIKEARRNMSIVLHDAENNEKIRFNFFNAWPSKVNLSPMQAGGSEVSVEDATFVHEGMTIG
jgi:phage tail-like protein